MKIAGESQPLEPAWLWHGATPHLSLPGMLYPAFIIAKMIRASVKAPRIKYMTMSALPGMV
jgi:hypothetical protein